MALPSSNDKLIALFVKAPVLGRVKTRLANDIGKQAACELYCQLVSHAINNALACDIPLVICHDGSREDMPESWRLSAAYCLAQQGADLGERMVAAFSKLFTDGASQVILIGSDIPGLDTNYLQSAFQLLAGYDVVVGPALDGGYSLIGFHQQSFNPGLFKQIPWSTDQVLQLTLSAAERTGLSVGLLPTLRDIDTREDLLALEQEYGEAKPWKGSQE